MNLLSLQWHRERNSSSTAEAQSTWYALLDVRCAWVHVASWLHQCLHAVVLACRDEKRGEQLRLSLEQNAKANGNSRPQAEVMLLDVSSMQSVRSFAQQWNQRQKPLHCLINNAGVFDMSSSKPCSPHANTHKRVSWMQSCKLHLLRLNKVHHGLVHMTKLC